VVDTTSGSQTDRPVVVDVGYGPGDWGTNSGAVIVDNVVVSAGP